jgi:hypothetical protein
MRHNAFVRQAGLVKSDRILSESKYLRTFQLSADVAKNSIRRPAGE